jgi:O-antigen ligase
MNRYTSFAVFLYSAISLIVPSGFSVGAGLLVLGSLVLLRDRAVVLSREDRLVVAVFAFYFVVAVAMNLLHGEIIKEYDQPLRFLLAIPALLLLRAYPPAPAMFWSGLIIGGILAGLYTGWQYLIVNTDPLVRAGGHTNPIQYGNISSIIGMLCLAGLGWAMQQERRVYWVALLLGGFVMGMLGSLFTGSRGSWVGLPFCLWILYRAYGGEVRKRYVLGGFTAVVLAVALAYAIPRTAVKERVHAAINETMSYLQTRNADSSLGTRLEMWRVGYLAAAERPVLGWGKSGFVKWESAQISAGRIDPLMEGNNHVYNEWFDAVVKRGLAGLIALLALYGVPLWLFRKHAKAASRRARPYAVAGMMLITNYICFGFSQVFLAHNTGVMTLAFSLVILWGLLRAEDRLASAQH